MDKDSRRCTVYVLGLSLRSRAIPECQFSSSKHSHLKVQNYKFKSDHVGGPLRLQAVCETSHLKGHAHSPWPCKVNRGRSVRDRIALGSSQTLMLTTWYHLTEFDFCLSRGISLMGTRRKITASHLGPWQETTKASVLMSST